MSHLIYFYERLVGEQEDEVEDLGREIKILREKLQAQDAEIRDLKSKLNPPTVKEFFESVSYVS